MLLLDKPSGITSNAALGRVKRLYGAAKAGHTGTLDPLASGLLPLCLGEATKFAQLLLDAPKRYRATIHFGATTATQDAEGEVVETRPVTFGEGALEEALHRFTGPQVQVPPAHSALKFEGRPYYDYARRGIEIPRAPRAITIHALRLVQWQAPMATLDIECSKGTYVRALASDLGETLGCGAHLAALRRTGSGRFSVDDALTIEALEGFDCVGRDARLLDIDATVAGLPRLTVDADAARRLGQGQALAIGAAAPGCYRCYGPSGFIGLVEAGDALRALRMLNSH